ncbi:MAG: deoxyribodipyrimidine photo-lyase [Paracoccus sp. (in: a-proteobacteria)]|uniref:cryptochrome/photolyase family protein n=1 Tax=Paracoccus sp. TaxID=267 RepID=UPI0026DF8A7E|nr:deoxyribodipyrimidine photo-lyase [Paracoccus sp. (in: a-proteobacteria)]MDO5620928.1 deoxyribodipyrimidine photo-lyase [Paracoccus sp. (in: a-proteobacteria)]
MTPDSSGPAGEAVSLVWLGRDLRLSDNPALSAAASRGRVVPVFLLEDAPQGAAARWRIGQALAALSRDLAGVAPLVVLHGRGDMLALAERLRADEIHLNSALPFFRVDPAAVERPGLRLVVHPGNWLLPPGRLRTGQGGGYRRFTPFWQALRQQDIAPPIPAPRLHGLPVQGVPPEVWGLDRAMNRGASVLAGVTAAGEAAARDRLAVFLTMTGYAQDRDRPDLPDACSGLSDALAVGEISARQIWQAGRQAMVEGNPAAEPFLRELAWRDFARDLFHHAPDMAGVAWNPDWAGFPWRGDNADAEAWRRGQTGVDLVDAGMRQLYATGKMHNRVRMVVASYLTKRLLTDWRVGLDWFADTLTDLDPASNAMNWQWVAGSGPDAAPFFRIFNPDTQAEKFDPKARYRDYWLRGKGAAAFAAAVPRSWPDPLIRPACLVIGLAEGRALVAYEAARKAR